MQETKKNTGIVWKDIPKYKGYQVSNTGLVRTHNKVTSNARFGERHWEDRVLKPKKRKDGKRGGDCRVGLWRDGKVKDYKISRLVAFTFFGGDINNSNITVNHIDGDWENNNIENLELVSLKANIAHGFDNGLYPACRKTEVFNLMNGEKIVFRSMSQASVYMRKSAGYVSRKIKNGVYSDGKFKWNIIA